MLTKYHLVLVQIGPTKVNIFTKRPVMALMASRPMLDSKAVLLNFWRISKAEFEAFRKSKDTISVKEPH